MTISPWRRPVARGALGLMLIGGAWSGWMYTRGSRERPPSITAPTTKSAPTAGRGAPPAPSLTRHPAEVRALEPNDVPGASYAAALKMFREYSKYPPNSRPVDDSYSDIAAPLTITAPPQPLWRKDAAGKPLPSAVACVMQPAMHHVIRGAVQLVTLRCTRGSARDIPAEQGLPLLIDRVEAESHGSERAAALPSIRSRFIDDGSQGDELAGDGTYTLMFPTAGLAAGVVRVSALVQLANREQDDPIDGQPLTADFEIAGPAPARFTDRVSDRMRDGSLIVTVELQVERAGRYRVFANLEHKGELVAYAKEDRDLQTGAQQVELLYFGKILHDSQIDGAFDITHLRGQRFNLDGEGELSEPLEVVVRAHRTAAYRAADFSAEEWSSPYKTERITELTALAAMQER